MIMLVLHPFSVTTFHTENGFRRRAKPGAALRKKMPERPPGHCDAMQRDKLDQPKSDQPKKPKAADPPQNPQRQLP
jgi:hypothetical protein